MYANDLIYYLRECINNAESQDKDYLKVEAHFQQEWPLKAQIENVRLMYDDTIAIAIGPGTEYGSKEAWE